MTAEPGSEPSALILFAHGSRDPQWAEPFRTIQRSIAKRKPAVVVDLAFLEMMEPTLPAAIDRLVASGHSRFTIAPLFMAQGAHLKRDLKELVSKLRERHPQIQIALLPAAGEADPVLDAIGSWVADHV